MLYNKTSKQNQKRNDWSNTYVQAASQIQTVKVMVGSVASLLFCLGDFEPQSNRNIPNSCGDVIVTQQEFLLFP
jgi:hypothetical protein